MKTKSDYQKARDRVIKVFEMCIETDAKLAFEKLARIEAAINCFNGHDTDEKNDLELRKAFVLGEINALRKGRQRLLFDA